MCRRRREEALGRGVRNQGEDLRAPDKGRISTWIEEQKPSHRGVLVADVCTLLSIYRSHPGTLADGALLAMPRSSPLSVAPMTRSAWLAACLPAEMDDQPAGRPHRCSPGTQLNEAPASPPWPHSPGWGRAASQIGASREAGHWLDRLGKAWKQIQAYV